MQLLIDLWCIGLLPCLLSLLFVYLYSLAKANNKEELAKLATIAKGAVQWAEEHFATGEMKKAQALNRINKAIENSPIADLVTSKEVNKAIEDAVKELRQRGENANKE